jgi:hypothetical protein
MSFLPKTPVAPARNIRIPIPPFANVDGNVYRFVTARERREILLFLRRKCHK